MVYNRLERRLRAVERALYSTQSPWAQQYWAHVKQQLGGEAKMSLAEDYNRIIGNAWDGVPRADKRTLTLEHGEQYAVEYWRRHFETATVPWNSVKKTSGNRNSWVRNRQLKINVSDGWEDLKPPVFSLRGSSARIQAPWISAHRVGARRCLANS